MDVLTTPMSYSKTLRTHGKTFSPFSILTLPIILSQTQTLLLHLLHSTCLKLMKRSISKLRRISTRDRGIGTSANMKKTQETCHHPAIHPLHDDTLSLSHSFWCNHPCDSRLSFVTVLIHMLYFCQSLCLYAFLLLKSLSVCFTFVKVLIGMLSLL